MNRILLLALSTILLVGQGPSPNQTAPKGVQKNAQSNQNNSQRPMVVAGRPTTDNDETDRSKQTQTDSPQSVNVVSAPKILTESKKDAYDKALVIATWALVIIGAFQIIFLWRTVNATRDNAKAAKDQGHALMNIERAWILLGDFKDERRTHNRDGIDAIVTFSNYGSTPAWVTETSLRFLLINEEALSAPLEYAPPTTYGNGEPVPPGRPLREIRVPIEIVEYLVGRSNEGTHVFFGYIKYRDAFYEVTKKQRETRVRMRFERTRWDVVMDRPGRWVPDGPPDANRHT